MAPARQKSCCRRAAYGDVVLARKDVPTSHLAVVVDDAAQNISQ